MPSNASQGRAAGRMLEVRGAGSYFCEKSP